MKGLIIYTKTSTPDNESQDISFSEDRAILTVTYDLYGDLCEEQDFFIPRSILPDTEKSHEKNVQNSENN